MNVENISRPGEPVQDGDVIRITHGNSVVETKTWYAPSQVEAETVKETRIARDDFIERFTPKEWLAGQKLAQTDANLAMALAILMGKPDGMVDPSSPRVARALGIMVQLGVLTPARAAVIGAAQEAV